MRTTPHADAALYPDFTPYLAKYGDNGGARTRDELARYFREYRARDVMGFLRDQLDARCVRPFQADAARWLRRAVGGDSALFRAVKGAYWGCAGPGRPDDVLFCTMFVRCRSCARRSARAV